MIHVGSSPVKFLSLAVIASSAIGTMSYSHVAQAGEVTAKQIENKQSTVVAEAKIPTVSQYKTASTTSDKAAALKGTVSPAAPANLVADAPIAQASGTSAKATVKSSEGFYVSLSPLLMFGRSVPAGGGTDNKVGSSIGISAAAGYKFSDFRAEGELLYSKQNATEAGAGNSGSFSTFAIFANGYYDIPAEGGFKPYVGAGLGLAFNSLEASGTLNGTGGIPSGNGSFSLLGSSLAYQLKAGVAYAVSDQFDLGLGFRLLGQSKYSGTLSATVNGVAGSKPNIEVTPGTAFIAEVTARFRF
jgi:opacity protein-like surface antigen